MMSESSPTSSSARRAASSIMAVLCGGQNEVDSYEFAVNWMLFFTSNVILISAIGHFFLKSLGGSMGLFVTYGFYFSLYVLTRLKIIKIAFALNVLTLLFVPALTLGWILDNGYAGTTLYYFTIVPVALFVFFRGMKRRLLIIFFFLYAFALLLLEYSYPEIIVRQPSNLTTLFFTILNLLTSSGVAAGSVYYFHTSLSAENAISEFLLLNILPAKIAADLKPNRNKVVAHKFDSVTVFFADIEGFTTLSESLPARDVVVILNEVFSYLDSLVEKYGLEKIKTIGDCYMLAGGVPPEYNNHAATTTQLALEFLNYIKYHKFGGYQLSFRIGISTGSALAGIVGKHKFLYDLWGDAVIHAQKLEQLCPSGQIYMSESTYRLIRHHFKCVSAGVVMIQNATIPIWCALSPQNAALPNGKTASRS